MTTKNTELAEIQSLAAMAETAKSTRLTPAQETEAVGFAKVCLLAGKAAIASAVESILNLPWIVGVTAITETWPELKATSRKNLLGDLAAAQTEQGRRFRLSLARGLLANDAPAALKLIAATSAEMTATENGQPSLKDAQILSNVLIGKGKPWLLRLPLADFKKSEAETLIRCVVVACFPGQCPPLTQLSVIKWIAQAGQLATLPEPLMESITKAIKRWHPKMRAQLKADVLELPPAIEETLNAAPPQPERANAQQERTTVQEDRGGEQPGRAPAQERREPARQEKRQEQQPRSQSQRPPKGGHGGFDLNATLRQIEAHVQSLRSELNQANARLSQQPDQPRGRGRDRERRRPEPTESDPVEIEALQRHNQQLEETIKELRLQLEDLAADHEDIAASMDAHSETPISNEAEQLRALLGIKLKEVHGEFEKLAKEPPDEVFREHYRLLLEDVFNELAKQGVEFKG